MFGRQPSPRALIQGFDDQDETADAVAGLFPTTRKIDSLEEVRQGEYDILITNDFPWPDPEPHLFVVAVGGSYFGEVEPPDPLLPQMGGTYPESRPSVYQAGHSKATEFEVPDDLPPPLKRVVHADLLPVCKERRSEDEPLPYLDVDHSRGEPVSTFVRPLLTTTEPVVVAAVFRRRRGGLAQCLVLPDGVDVVAWTAAAVETWCEVDPKRFPAPPAWKHSDRWMTVSERERVKELTNVEQEWKAVEAAFARRRADAERALVEARAAADARQRRLLVAQGDDLVAGVADALRAIGFDVRDMDAAWPTNDRREDLRVAAPDDPAWSAIVEARGYVRGAAQNDLLRIAARFVPRYMQDEGDAPSAAWYIVNHHIRQDPGQRPRVLAGNDPEIATFAEGAAPGLVIDTVTLFELLDAVERGVVQPAEARRALITQTGIFRAPPAAS